MNSHEVAAVSELRFGNFAEIAAKSPSFQFSISNIGHHPLDFGLLSATERKHWQARRPAIISI
jgi:hypothetical protein